MNIYLHLEHKFKFNYIICWYNFYLTITLVAILVVFIYLLSQVEWLSLNWLSIAV